jgi:hypothetical protein
MADSQAKMCPRSDGAHVQLEFIVKFEPSVAPDLSAPPQFTVEYESGGRTTVKAAVVPGTYIPPGGPNGDAWRICTTQLRYKGRLILRASWRTGASATPPGRDKNTAHAFEAGSQLNHKRLDVYLAGPVITVLGPGADTVGYGEQADRYWTAKNGVAPLDYTRTPDATSLWDILQRLDAEMNKMSDPRPWGQVNIVVHGNPHAIKMRLFPGTKEEEAWIHKDAIQKLIKGSTLKLECKSITDHTDVVFRACSAGQDQGLVDEIKRLVFPHARSVRIPKHAQVYELENGKPVARFYESLIYGTPTNTAAADPAKMSKAYEALIAMGSPGTPASINELSAAELKAEIATFAKKHDFPLEHSVGDYKSNTEDHFDSKTGAPLKGDERTKALWEEQNNQIGASAFWYTAREEWSFGRKGPDDAPPLRLPAETPTSPPQLYGIVEIPSGGSVNSGGVPLGAGTHTIGSFASDGWWVQGVPKLAGNHLQIEVNGSTATIQGAGALNVVGDLTEILKAGDKRMITVKGGVDITLEPTTVKFHLVRFAESPLCEAKYYRLVIDRMRELRRFEKGVPYGSRKFVDPEDINDIALFAESRIT